MNNKNVLTIACIIIIGLPFLLFSQESQPSGPDCGNLDDATESPHIFNFNPGYAGTIGSSSVLYKSSNFSEGTDGYECDIRVDWETLSHDFVIVDDEVIKRMTEEDIVKSKAMSSPVSEGEIIVFSHFLSSCKSTVYATYRLETSSLKDCCDPGFPADKQADIEETMVNGETIRTITVGKSVNCGMKCCAKKYTCEVYYDDFSGTPVRKVKITNREVIETSDCESNTTFDDCDGNPIPCSGVCRE